MTQRMPNHDPLDFTRGEYSGPAGHGCRCDACRKLPVTLPVTIIRDAIDRFSFSCYGLDDVDAIKEDPGCREWIEDLATAIAIALGKAGANLA